MTNEDIVRTLEEFVKWGNDDKIKVMKSLSHQAITNLSVCLSVNKHHAGQRTQRVFENGPVLQQVSQGYIGDRDYWHWP
jgi:hypothetical protein